MEYCIRTAVESDASGINKVSKFLGYAELSDEDATKKIAHLVLSRNNEIYVLESKESVIGWLHLIFSSRVASADFYEIGGLVIDPHYRRNGLGRALINYVAERCQGKIRVRCNESREDAHIFYKSIGFEAIKKQQIYEMSL